MSKRCLDLSKKRLFTLLLDNNNLIILINKKKRQICRILLSTRNGGLKQSEHNIKEII